MPKNKRTHKVSSGITKEIRAARHKLHQQRKPYYSRMGFPTRTAYRQWKKEQFI